MKKFLFTTHVSNDLGLLTRSLPIAHALRERGHQIAFCNPAKAPSKLISEAGFDNIPPQWPLFYVMSGDISLPAISRVFRSKHIKRDLGILASFIRHMMHSSTAEIWNVDHFTYLFGMWNETSVRRGLGTFLGFTESKIRFIRCLTDMPKKASIFNLEHCTITSCFMRFSFKEVKNGLKLFGEDIVKSEYPRSVPEPPRWWPAARPNAFASNK